MKQNPKALEAVWDYAYERVGYLGTNTPIDRCYECGYEGEFKPTAKGFECPICKNRNPKTCDVVKRTCGYLGKSTSFAPWFTEDTKKLNHGLNISLMNEI